MEEMRHLPFIAKNADAQVGRIVDALEAEGHARRDPDRDHGRPRRADRAPLLRRARSGRVEPALHPPSTGIRSDCNWYFGRTSDEIYLDPSPAVAALRDRLGAGNLAFSYQDGHVAAWLNDNSLAKKREAAARRSRHGRT